MADEGKLLINEKIYISRGEQNGNFKNTQRKWIRETGGNSE